MLVVRGRAVRVSAAAETAAVSLLRCFIVIPPIYIFIFPDITAVCL